MASLKLLCLFFFFFLNVTLPFTTIAEAREFIVGGRAHAWKVPSPAEPTLNQWAESMRFQVGDSLVWILGGAQKESVLEVTRADYLTCNTSSPIADHTYGTATVKLDRSGPYYFIGGVEGACEKGEKVAVVVMGERHRRNGGGGRLVAAGGPALAPAPNGAEDGPAVAPTSRGSRMSAAVAAGKGGARI